MNLRELRHALRDMLNDVIAPHRWSDETLNRFLNNAVREVCLRARLLYDDAVSNPTLCTYIVQPGQAVVKLKADILVVRSGFMVSATRKMWCVTSESLDRRVPEWDSAIATPGEPEWLVMDLAQQTVRLHPTPVNQDTLKLRVWRRPLEKERMVQDDDTPAINIPGIEELKHWAAHEAYLKNDGETPDEERSGNHLAMFEQRFGSRPSIHELARWADSPPRLRHSTMF